MMQVTVDHIVGCFGPGILIFERPGKYTSR